MSSNTKILVLKARELIYTLIFAVLGIALVMLLIYMFSDKNENGNTDSSISTSEASTDTGNDSTSETESSSETSSATEDSSATGSSVTSSDDAGAEAASAIITTTTYVPGNYAAPINLGGTILNLEVYIDDTCVPTASITNLDETTKEMYPLIEPALAEINNQLAEGLTPDEITYSHDNKYTSLVIIDAIRTALLE